MQNILPDYSDPLFSILLIVAMALIIALVTYAWGIYHQQKEQGNLLKFLEKFDSSECAFDTEDTPFESHMLQPLMLLAKAFESAGAYPKAISIYLYILKNMEDESHRSELMERLGSTYLHAGFLERARSIYSEILRKRPRNRQVLHELGVVYEMMHRYDRAKEVIEPLETLGEEVAPLRAFLDFCEVRYDKALSSKAKIVQLRGLLTQAPALYRQIVGVMLQLDTHEAWRIIDPERLDELIDILWFLPDSQLDLDIIASSGALRTLYYAKGYLPTPACESGIFSLDMLATAKRSGFEEGDLLFSYLCQKCKQSFPISFGRCPNCMAINSLKVEEKIAKATPQTHYSLL